MADDSIWKKELSFKRKPKEQAEDATPAADAEKPASIWKKELSLKKSPDAKSAAEAETVVEETPADDPGTDEPDAAEPAAATIPRTRRPPRNMLQGQPLPLSPTSLSGRRK